MFKESITPQDITDTLNELLKSDYDGIKNFVSMQAIVNKEIANHHTIQVNGYDESDKYKLGIMGFLNGLFGINENGFGCIYYSTDDNDKIIKFGVNYNLKNKEK